MSWQDAPLYVRAHDLAVDLHGRLPHLPDAYRASLGCGLAREASTILSGVALGLTFPDERALHQAGVDEAIVRLRVHLRVAEALGVLSTGAASHVHDQLTDIGRMLGGWRKRETRRLAERKPTSGGGPPLRPGA